MRVISVFVLDGQTIVSFERVNNGGYRQRSHYDVSPRSLDRLGRCVLVYSADIRPFLAGCVGYTARIWEE